MTRLIIIAALLIATSAAAQSLDPVPNKDRIASETVVSKGRTMNGVPAKISQRKYAWRVVHSDGVLRCALFFSDARPGPRMRWWNVPHLPRPRPR